MYPHRHYTSYTRRRECNICTTRLASKVRMELPTLVVSSRMPHIAEHPASRGLSVVVLQQLRRFSMHLGFANVDCWLIDMDTPIARR